jgi:N-sulfoglucosamine sulfohydrolase
MSVVVCGMLPRVANADTATARPNIVLIIADDLGAEDSGPYGCKGVRTPNLDLLAREGMKFLSAFNTCSSCSPSRSSIITGRYPHNTGAEMLHLPLPKEQVTFVEKLKAAGYWTAASGKWHLGNLVRDRFDVVNSDVRATPVGNDDGSGCVKWISTLQERPKDKPFFLWLASIDPHRPYFDGTLAVPHKPEETEVPPFLPDAPPTRKDFAMYYDEIGRLDGYVGKVFQELKRQGMLDNTVIFFITDNGRPFPRCKTSVYDSGIQSPLLIRWPGHIKAGSSCRSLVSSIDLAPTILELAGLPPLPTFQGKSYARLLSQPEESIRDSVFAEHNWHDFTACERSVRTARFKYIRNFWPDLPGTPAEFNNLTFTEMRRLRDAGKLTDAQMNCFVKPRPAEELYDVAADPQELRNLANNPKYADTLTELRERLEAWRRDTADFVPSPRPADSVDRETGKVLPGAVLGKPPVRGQSNARPPAS